MSDVTSPIITDATGQAILNKLNEIKQVLSTPSDAEDINYDNTTSGMTADNVQGAIDELKSNLIKLDKFTVSCPHTTVSSNYYYGRTSIATQLAEYTNIIAVIPIFVARAPGVDAVHALNYSNYTLTDGYFTGGQLEVSSNRTGTSTVMVYVLHL